MDGEETGAAMGSDRDRGMEATAAERPLRVLGLGPMPSFVEEEWVDVEGETLPMSDDGEINSSVD